MRRSRISLLFPQNKDLRTPSEVEVMILKIWSMADFRKSIITNNQLLMVNFQKGSHAKLLAHKLLTDFGSLRSSR